MTQKLDLEEVAAQLREFARERDWEQFHTPKNLAMALAGEAGELLEIFQWLTPDQSEALSNDQLQHVGEELTDILVYLVRLADVLRLDLGRAFDAKHDANARRYPADHVRGSAAKR